MLVRKETSPEDVAGMHLAKGILTATGGKASHAAVVARGWGKPCVVGCDAIQIDEKAGTITVGGQTIKAGDYLTIDGTTGDVMIGKVPTVDPTISGDFATLMAWADKVRTLKVRTNADTPEDAAKAREFGAEGIGLCRTEHMFFGDQRIVAMRKMILADDEAGRKAALAELEPFQKQDFIGIFEAMDGLPVTIRLLDPPLHEFLPRDDNPRARPRSPRSSGSPSKRSSDRVEQLHEVQPDARLPRLPAADQFPEIGDMQVRAIIEAAIEVKKTGQDGPARDHDPAGRHRRGADDPQEAGDRHRRGRVEEGRRQGRVSDRHDDRDSPRRPDRRPDRRGGRVLLVRHQRPDPDDLRLFSRDDIGSFMPAYVEQKILPVDPFQTIDVKGVGQLIEIGVTKGRKARQEKHGEHLKVGNLRRARRRPRQRRLLPQGGHGLRLLLAVPRPDRPAGRRPGRPGRR